MKIQQSFQNWLNQYQVVEATIQNNGWNGFYIANGSDTERIFLKKERKQDRDYAEQICAELNANLEAAE